MRLVAPTITEDDYNTGRFQAVDVFEAQIMDWTLNWAKQLLSKPHSGLAVMMLSSATIEPLGGAILGLRGKNSEVKWIEGIRSAFPSLSHQDGKDLCEHLRNGLFHEAFIKCGVELTSQDDAIKRDGGVFVIDPVRFVSAVEASAARVIKGIREGEASSEAVTNFLEYWNRKASNNEKKLRIEPRTANPGGLSATTAAAGVELSRVLREL